MSRLQSWSILVLKVFERLSSWKVKSLSIGSHLTLLKSVLGGISNYYITFHKVPVCIISKNGSF